MAGKDIELNSKRNNIYVETGTEMSLATGDLDFSGKCTYVGRRENQYIVVTPPSNFSANENKLLQADRLMVRYLFEGDIFEFKSKLLEIKSNPLMLLLLQYPVSVEKKELRSQKRISCFISAKMEKALRIDDHIALGFGFPGIFDRQEILGKIKDIRMKENSLDVGIEFASIAWWVPPYE